MTYAEPMIFDSEDREQPRTYENMELVYDSPNNNTLMYLNELPGRYGKFLRDMSHRWLHAMPDGGNSISDKLNPYGRGRKYEGVKDDWEFRLCWWQMFVNQIFKPRAVSSEFVTIRTDEQTSLKYRLVSGQNVLIDCGFVHEHAEQMQVEEKKRTYEQLLKQIFAASGMCAVLWMHDDQPSPPKSSIREAAEYCMRTPIGGKAEVFFDGNQVLVTDENVCRSMLSSTLTVSPSRTGETITEVSITRSYSGDSKHLSQIEQALDGTKMEELQDTPFVLAVSTNLSKSVFDIPAVYRTLYEHDDSIFISGKWHQVSGVLIGSPLPWHLSNVLMHDVPLTLFLNPNASTPLPEILKMEMPYVVDTIETKVHHNIAVSAVPDIHLSEYLSDENFVEWEELRAENVRERNESMCPSLSAETQAELQTILQTPPTLTDEQVEWLHETGVINMYENAKERLPWGGSATRRMVVKTPGVLEMSFSEENVSVDLAIDIPNKKCTVSISMISISEKIFQYSYDLTYRNSLWSAITDIHKVLYPETIGKTYLHWESVSHPLPENITKSINNILRLHQNSSVVPPPDILATGDSLMIDWKFPRNMIILIAELRGETVTWVDHGVGTRDEFRINDKNGWQDLREYLISIPPADPLG